MGDDVRWRPNVYSRGEEMSLPHALEDGAEPPADWYPVMWDAERGYVGREQGAFTAITAMDSNKVEGNLQEPGYKHTIMSEAYY
jgi:hypothetical protein